MRRRPSRGRLLWGAVALLATGCARDVEPEPVEPIIIPPPPPAAATAATPTGPLVKPRHFSDLGLTVSLPEAWVESLAPAVAGAGARMLHRADGDKPAILIAGIASRPYSAWKTDLQTAGKVPFEEIAGLMRNQILGTGVSAILPTDPTGKTSLGSASTAGAAGRLLSEKAWPTAAFNRARVSRYEGQDAKPDGTPEKVVVDIYLGEAKSGSLYILAAVAGDENALDQARSIVDTVVVTGVKDSSATLPGLRDSAR